MVKMKTINLKITGMHCSSCEILIKDALNESGVNVEKISHDSGKAQVSFDEKKVDEKKIKSIIKNEGYGVE